ncbi:MAG TPA: electron transfer flavoprotein subunit alpha/FixB family protein [Anaerolineae bacterium]|nr:electron transfer flavoprotein subunit alpha/FixB family protein [Anaerolineae bacterium]
MSVLVWIEQFQGRAVPISWEVMGKARELADVLGTSLIAIVAGEDVASVAQEAVSYGADTVYLADNPVFSHFRVTPYATLMEQLIREQQPQIVLTGASTRGRDLSAAVAADMGIGLAPDCIELAIEDGNLVATRTVYSGNILATIHFKGTPQMASVRNRAFPAPEPDAGRIGEVVSIDTPIAEEAVPEKVTAFEAAEAGEVSLTDARIIVSGGRGVKGPEGFAPIRELAEVLNAAVGASRAAVDAGWIPYKHQVGQTGKTVRPDLYIACGISGAIQHLAGMNSSKVIVAINKDPEAPIFKVANYGIVGDVFTYVPALTEEFKQRLQK